MIKSGFCNLICKVCIIELSYYCRHLFLIIIIKTEICTKTTLQFIVQLKTFFCILKLWRGHCVQNVFQVICEVAYTRKNGQLVTNIQQSCTIAAGSNNFYQDVLALLVASLLTTCVCFRVCFRVFKVNRFNASCSHNLLSSSDLQLLNKLLVTALEQLKKMTNCYNLLTLSSLVHGCYEHMLLTSCKIFTCVHGFDVLANLL